PRLIGRLGAGDSFGELGLLTGSPRTATVRAATPVEAFRVDRSTFQRLLADRATTPNGYEATGAQLLELRALRPFTDLPAEELAALVHAGAWVEAGAGTVVVRQGEVG